MYKQFFQAILSIINGLKLKPETAYLNMETKKKYSSDWNLMIFGNMAFTLKYTNADPHMARMQGNISSACERGKFVARSDVSLLTFALATLSTTVSITPELSTKAGRRKYPETFLGCSIIFYGSLIEHEKHEK